MRSPWLMLHCLGPSVDIVINEWVTVMNNVSQCQHNSESKVVSTYNPNLLQALALAMKACPQTRCETVVSLPFVVDGLSGYMPDRLFQTWKDQLYLFDYM